MFNIGQIRTKYLCLAAALVKTSLSIKITFHSHSTLLVPERS